MPPHPHCTTQCGLCTASEQLWSTGRGPELKRGETMAFSIIPTLNILTGFSQSHPSQTHSQVELHLLPTRASVQLPSWVLPSWASWASVQLPSWVEGGPSRPAVFLFLENGKVSMAQCKTHRGGTGGPSWIPDRMLCRFRWHDNDTHQALESAAVPHKPGLERFILQK